MRDLLTLRPRQLGAALALLGALLLSGCIVPARSTNPGPTSVPSTPLPPTAAPPTTLPPTVEPPTATVPATTVPQVLPPTVRPPLPPLLGPEWRVHAQGDLYGTGVETVIASTGSANVVVPRLQPPYVGFGVAAEQVVVVQRNTQGQPWVRLQISLNGLFFNGDNRNPVSQPGLPDQRTIALAVALEQPSALIRIVPLDRDGRAVAQGFVARYANGGMLVEPLVLPGQPVPPAPAPAPLLGPEWVILGQGDLYGLGAETVVAYRPADPPVGPIQLPAGYDGFTTTVGQLVAVQRNAQGQPWVRLLISPGGVQLSGDDRTPVYPPGGPNSRAAAFALAYDTPAGPFRLVPIDMQGKAVETGFTARYDQGSRSFVFSEIVPPNRPAVVSGRVSYPAGWFPAFEVYAINADDPTRFYTQRTEVGWPYWGFRLPPGRYYLLAYLTEPGATAVGGYSEYVRCGTFVECVDHSLVAVKVDYGENIGEMNIGDWAAPEGAFPPRPMGQPQLQP